MMKKVIIIKDAPYYAELDGETLIISGDLEAIRRHMREKTPGIRSTIRKVGKQGLWIYTPRKNKEE